MLEFLKEKIKMKGVKEERWFFIYNKFSYKVNQSFKIIKTNYVQYNEPKKSIIKFLQI